MLILVYIRDGRTVYKIKGRARLRQLVGVDPWHEEPGVEVERGTWNPQALEFVWKTIKVRHIAKGSISCVEEVPREAGS